MRIQGVNASKVFSTGVWHRVKLNKYQTLLFKFYFYNPLPPFHHHPSSMGPQSCSFPFCLLCLSWLAASLSLD